MGIVGDWGRVRPTERVSGVRGGKRERKGAERGASNTERDGKRCPSARTQTGETQRWIVHDNDARAVSEVKTIKERLEALSR